MTAVRVIVLGNPHASDDGAALRAAASVRGAQVVAAGRPGTGLLELLSGDEPVVLVDVTRSGARPGTIHRLALSDLADASLAATTVSSHGFGPAQALQLGKVLGRELPAGTFIGVEGAHFDPGDELTAEVADALPALVDAIEAAIAEVDGCTRLA